MPPLDSRAARSAAFQENTVPYVDGFPRAGSAPVSHDGQRKPNVVAHPARSFSNQRALQILRQASTQMFHGTHALGINPVEVQTMLLRGSLFVSMNDIAAAKRLFEKLTGDPAALQRMLMTQAEGDQVEKKYSRRHAAKLRRRVYGGEQIAGGRADDVARAHAIAGLLARGRVRSLDMANAEAIDAALATEECIYIVTGVPAMRNHSDHAEQWLADIKDRTADVEVGVVAGKKRPCMICFGRLKTTPGLEHLEAAGLAWKVDMEAQAILPAAERSALEMMTGVAHTSDALIVDRHNKLVHKDDITDHGSESDSENHDHVHHNLIVDEKRRAAAAKRKAKRAGDDRKGRPGRGREEADDNDDDGDAPAPVVNPAAAAAGAGAGRAGGAAIPATARAVVPIARAAAAAGGAAAAPPRAAAAAVVKGPTRRR